jgi:two-component system, NtrC family, sensor kinase
VARILLASVLEPSLIMERPFSRRTLRLGALVLLAVLLAALGTLSAYQKVQTFQPLGAQAQREEGRWLVTSVTHPGTGLLLGDSILLVDGAVPGSASELERFLASDARSTLTLLRGEELVTLVYRRPPLEVDFPYLLLAAVAIVYLAVGLYVLLHGRGRPAGLFFLWSLASFVVYFFTYVPGALGAPLGPALFLVEGLARLLLPALTLHLFLVFPLAALPRRSLARVVPFLYLPSASLALLHLDLMSGGALIGRAPSTTAVAALDRLSLSLLVAYGVAAIGVLGWQLLRAARPEQRRQVRWVASGLTAGYLPFVALYALPWALGHSPSQWLTTLAVLPLGLVPLAFAWAIFRHKLWDLEIFLRSTVSYTATLLVGVLSFSLLHLAISRGFPDQGGLTRSALTFVAGLLIAGVLVPTQRALRTGLERLQYRGTFRKRRALADLGLELLEERDLPRLSQRLVEQVAESLDLERVTLYLAAKDGLHLVEPLPELPEIIPWGAFDPDLWSEQVRLISDGSLPRGEGSALSELFSRGYRYALPVVLRHRPMGLLLTGFKAGLQPLNSEEIDVVRALLNQAALALENAQLLEALRRQLHEVTRLKHHSEQILDSSPAGIVLLDAEQRVVSANHAFSHLVGVEREQAVGHAFAELLPVSPLPAPGDPLLEVSYCDAGGRERYLQLSSAGYAGADGDLRVVVVHDVSQRVAMENELKEKDRLAALGMLAAGVAHEVNTPITGISSYAQMLLANTSSDDPRRELLQKVEQQTFRAARIVNNLLEFARNRRQESRPMGVRRALAEAMETLEERLRRLPVEVVWEVPGEDFLVAGGEGELQQVFVNLLTNALDAMAPAGGRLTLAVESRDGRVVATVADTGHGIPSAELDKIFQPFYSTKLATGGTGLGLSISFQIVRRLGGDLRVESRPGEGSRFAVELPVVRPVETAC